MAVAALAAGFAAYKAFNDLVEAFEDFEWEEEYDQADRFSD